MAARKKTTSRRTTSTRKPSTSNLDHIPLSEFAARRQHVLKALGNCVGLVIAGDHNAHLSGHYTPHPHFEYLTGITDEPGAMLLLDPANPDKNRRETLLLKPLNPELEQWDGLRDMIGTSLRESTGFKTIFRTNSLARWLNGAVSRTKKMALLHPIAPYTAPVSPDLAIFRAVADRMPGASIEDKSNLLAELRAVKSPAEVEMIRLAGRATGVGFAAVARAIKPGVRERVAQSALEAGFVEGGSSHLAFDSIVGSGKNATVLHYKTNHNPLKDDSLVVVDAGAKWCGYSADVTRTFPVNGRFTKRQAEIYSIVLKAQLAAINACKPGVWMHEVDAAARKVISAAGYADAFMHGVGHHLGLETHDITPEGKLQKGNVVTIEPGIYLPDEELGVRIEDDVEITATGHRVLTSQIPKMIKEIEKMMAG
ncbi:MAG: aminopeptidase P family protein [Phycisphaeraceae bacterium]|nr:aminopeptidase P family protein [Phycisphaerales bacterium]MCB9860629.1 aminopeptidase P family protein [Phycisphaeraceae bacterium]